MMSYLDLAKQHMQELEQLAAEAAEISMAALKVGDLRVAAALARERRELVIALADARRIVQRCEER